MTTIILDVSDDIAAALADQCDASRVSIQALSNAVLEQWFLDQRNAPTETWTADDIAAIEDGFAQMRAGQTIPHSDARARILGILETASV
jgi:predicted transcriptional regulator